MNRSLTEHDPGALRGVLDWVDSRFGPIKTLWHMALHPPEPRWWVYGCELARAPIGTWSSPFQFASAGTSINPDQALQRTLGEALERYCSLNPIETEYRLMTTTESGVADLFPICAKDEPCPSSFKNLRVEAPLKHTMMRRLSDDSSVPVPAEYVHLASLSEGHESPLTQSISTGLAFDTELLPAIWRGLCEVVERDALMLAWLLRRPLREINYGVPEDIPNDVADRISRLNAVGLRVRLFDMTSDVRIPTILCLLYSDRYPYLTVGASCKADPVAACSKALDEAVSVRVSVQWERWSGKIPSVKRFDWVARLEHHMMLYAQWRDSPALQFLKHGGEPVGLDEFRKEAWWQAPDNAASLRFFAQKLADMGLTVLWTDITLPEVREFGWTVRVVVPEAVPLGQDHKARWLATPRLLGAAGLEKEASSTYFNPYPHPFA